jgi:hypothetical protein
MEFAYTIKSEPVTQAPFIVTVVAFSELFSKNAVLEISPRFSCGISFWMHGWGVLGLSVVLEHIIS